MLININVYYSCIHDRTFRLLKSYDEYIHFNSTYRKKIVLFRNELKIHAYISIQ